MVDQHLPAIARRRSTSVRAALALLTVVFTIVGTATLPAVLGLSANTAAAATDAQCHFASPGTGKYSGTLCWLDFSRLDAAQSASGQDFTFAIGGGNTVQLKVKQAGGRVEPAAFPTWWGAYLGNSGHYSGVAGKPALYQTADHTTSTLTVSDIRVIDPHGNPVSEFAIVGTDAESTDEKESITWQATTPIESLTAQGADPGIGNACAGGYTGLGTTTVKCTGAGTATKTGTPILAARHPQSFTQTMVGGGREAVAFGVLISALHLTKEVASRFPGDDFQVETSSHSGPLKNAQTGPDGKTATTGRHPVVTDVKGNSFTLAERAIHGDLRNYSSSWSCTRFGKPDPALPQGTTVGASAQVQVGVGDDIACTITNTARKPAISLHKNAAAPVDANHDGITDPGDTIAYTFEVANTGDTVLASVTVSDPLAGPVTCPQTELAPGASVTCTSRPYTITGDDADAGVVHNTATASGTPPGTDSTVTSAPSETRTPVQKPAPKLTLTKSASPSDASAYRVGQNITYSFTVTNTGNVPVSAVEVDEGDFSGSGKLSALRCPDQRTLSPDTSLVCTATYQLTQADIDAGQVTNSATAHGTAPDGSDVPTAPARAVVPVAAAPAVSLTKSTDPQSAARPGDEITYRFVITNTGNVSLTDPVVNETRFTGTGRLSGIHCPDGALAPGAAVTCTATYRVTPQDADAGMLDNTATATAASPSGSSPVSEPSSAHLVIPPTPAIAVEKSATPEMVAAPGDTITYRFTVTNTGNVTLHDVAVQDENFSGSGDLGDISCPETALAADRSMTCTAIYRVTQEDLDAGQISNTATASGTPPTGDPVASSPSAATVKTDPRPALSLTKTASPAEAASGQTVTYTFLVTNTGNVSVSNPAIEEGSFSGSGEMSEVLCPRDVLAPGASVTCTATYTVTDHDAGTGSVTNTAAATADPPRGMPRPRSADASAKVAVTPLPVPELALRKSADVASISAAGQTVTYTFEITNTGKVPVHDVTVQEGDFSGTGTAPALTCPPNRALDPGARLTCTAAYTVTQQDIDSGGLTNTATATGLPPRGGPPVVSAPSTVALPAAQLPSIALKKSADRTRLDLGETITYSFVVTNTGNVTVHDVSIDENAFTGSGPLTATCPAGPLAPGAQVVCTADYRVSQSDVDRGELTNTATAHATPPGGEPIDSTASTVKLPAEAQPALALSKTADARKPVSAGQVITYTFTLTNTGNTTLTDPMVHEDQFNGHGRLSPVTCSGKAALAPGEHRVCTAAYTVVQEDLGEDAIRNTATATAQSPSGDVRSAPSTATVPTPAPPASEPRNPSPGPGQDSAPPVAIDRPSKSTEHTSRGKNESLASTGLDAVPIALAATLLLVLGCLLAVLGRRRRRTSSE